MKDHSSYRSVLEVNLAFLKKNCKTLQSLSSASFFCPMVKAEAYGHGSLSVTQALLSCGVKQVGVMTLPEARSLRHNIKKPFDVLIFGPLLDEKDCEEVIEQGYISVCSHWDDLKYFAKQKKKLRLHLKFDTGFSRLGFSLSDAEKIKVFLEQNSFLKLEGLCTQLIEGSDISDSQGYSSHQIQKIQKLKFLFPNQCIHAFNTESLLASFVHEKYRDVGARPGIGLYGIKNSLSQLQSLEQEKWKSISLLPTTSLRSRVVNVRQLKKGDKVSYSGIWTASESSTVATVSLGYEDAFLRNWRGEVLLRGRRVPIIGHVCMDFFMIDVTSLGKEGLVQAQEEVVIFGQQGENYLSIEEHANRMKTVSHELFVSFGKRIHRHYKN